VIVTISREYGAAGIAVAQGVADALGYELLAEELPKTVAARLGTSADEIASRATTSASFTERVLGGLGAGTAEVATPATPRLPGDFDETMRREIERTIRERAERGNVVILGRNAAAVLGRRPDLVRVFLTAEREWRLARVMGAFGLERTAALAELERVDAARRRLAKDRYRVAFGDARFYDLVIDTSRFGVEGAIEIVAGAVRAAERA